MPDDLNEAVRSETPHCLAAAALRPAARARMSCSSWLALRGMTALSADKTG
jgi:hypothetical protein